MARNELELFYERKLRVAMDVLDELDRLELLPQLTDEELGTLFQLRASWDREYALARAQYAGIRSGQSSLPLPPLAMRERMAELADQVEKQINANKAANAVVKVATELAGALQTLQQAAAEPA